MAKFGTDYEKLIRKWLTKGGSHESRGRIMFSSDGNLYSYGKHYMMARIIGPHMIEVNKDKSSATTQRHKNLVIKVANDLKINVEFVNNME